MTARRLRTTFVALLGVLASPVMAAEIDYAAIERAIASGRTVQAKAMLAQAGVPGEAVDTARLDGLAASLALAEGRNDVARDMFVALLRAQPQSCSFAGGGGTAALRLGDRQSAIALLERAVIACPRSAEALSRLATAYDQDDRWSDAEASFRRALAMEPGNASILNNAGWSLLRQKRFEDAVVLLERARDLDPGNQRIANNLDIALVSLRRPVAARPTDGAAMAPADRLNNAGYASYLAGHNDAARAYLSQALVNADVYSPRIVANLKLVEAGRGGD